MNTKQFLLRLLGLVVIAVLAAPLFGLVSNLTIMSGILADVPDGYGLTLTKLSIYVWAACLPLGFASIFIRENWRWILYFSPLYAPSIFAVVYSAMR